MSTNIRYMAFTNADAVNVARSKAADYLEKAPAVFDVLLPVIAANANAVVFRWNGPGKIYKILSHSYVNVAAGVETTRSQASIYTLALDATGKTVTMAIPNGGVASVATDKLCLTLLVGI